MTPDQRIQKLEAEARERTEALRQLRSQLASAENEFRRTRDDGSKCARLASDVRLAELALDGVRQDLERARAPRRVEITAPPDELLRQRTTLLAQRSFRHRQHAEQVALERQKCGGWPEAHIAIQLRNVFGSSERVRAKADAADQAVLDNIDQQLALLGEQQPLDAA